MAKRSLTSRRCGTIVHEAAIAIVLAGAILISVAQVLALSAEQSRSLHQRLTATRECGDLMEQLMARSWEQLTPEAATSMKLSDTCRATLPDARLEIGIETSDIITADGAKQVSIEIAWLSNAAGYQAAPVRLVAWKYARQETDQ